MCWAMLGGMAAQGGGSALQGQQNAEAMFANADMLDVKAADAEVRGGNEADISANKTQLQLGQQRAMMGASGIDMNTGTSSAVQTETEMTGGMDQATILANARREAWGYRTEAENLRAAGVAAGQMQRMLLPGMENGKFDFFPSKRTINASFLFNGYKSNNATVEYIKTGKG